MADDAVRRAFVDIAHGQVHCRLTGDLTAGRRPPLLMLHGGPGSSAGLAPMIRALGAEGIAVIAPDLMGNGLSDPPPVEPDLAFYIDCIVQLLDRLAVPSIDCYGHHVGAQIACELAIAVPGRVGRLVLDGVGLFSSDQRRAFLDRYAPPVEPDATGDHLATLWRFLTNATTRFPHFSEDAEDRLPGGVPLAPELLTDQIADVVRNWRTYHLSYRASFNEDFAARLPLVTQPTAVLAVAGDPLARYAGTATGLLADGRLMRIERAMRATAVAAIIHPDRP